MCRVIVSRRSCCPSTWSWSSYLASSWFLPSLPDNWPPVAWVHRETTQLTVHWWPLSTVQPITDPYELCTLWNHLASNWPNRLADSQKSRIGALPADLLKCPPLTSRVHHATFSRVGFTVCAPLSLLPWSSLSTAFTRFAVFILIRLLLLLVLSLKPSGFKVPGAKK